VSVGVAWGGITFLFTRNLPLQCCISCLSDGMFSRLRVKKEVADVGNNPWSLRGAVAGGSAAALGVVCHSYNHPLRFLLQESICIAGYNARSLGGYYRDVRRSMQRFPQLCNQCLLTSELSGWPGTTKVNMVSKVARGFPSDFARKNASWSLCKLPVLVARFSPQLECVDTPL
jgi:hypothetical protein